MELPELPDPWNTIDGELWGQNVTFEVYTADQMHTYAKQAAEAEREACAQECELVAMEAERMAKGGGNALDDGVHIGARECALAIRKRN